MAVVDVSHGMIETEYDGHTLLDTAREAVFTVFDTMTSKDTVREIFFMTFDIVVVIQHKKFHVYSKALHVCSAIIYIRHYYALR